MEVVVIIVQNSENKFYVNQRRDDKKTFPSLYGLGAGGKVDPGETPAQAAKRELKEELQIESDVQELFSFHFEHPVSTHQLHVFKAKHDGELQRCDEEWQWSGWMTKEEVDKLSEEGKLCPDTKILYERFRSQI